MTTVYDNCGRLYTRAHATRRALGILAVSRWLGRGRGDAKLRASTLRTYAIESSNNITGYLTYYSQSLQISVIITNSSFVRKHFRKFV